jgi:hypothetical protein
MRQGVNADKLLTGIESVPRAIRSAWSQSFPNAIIHAPEPEVKRHRAYRGAKAGDVDAAMELNLSAEKLNELRIKHGELENWWVERFGFGFECLTASETRYLINTPTSERIRHRIEEADSEYQGTRR